MNESFGIAGVYFYGHRWRWTKLPPPPPRVYGWVGGSPKTRGGPFTPPPPSITKQGAVPQVFAQCRPPPLISPLILRMPPPLTPSCRGPSLVPLLHSTRTAKVLSEFFLADAQFIGGDAPDISDCYICMQLLLLYSTDFPPQNQVRP